MRRLIYSQLPLPLGTLPRSTASSSDSPLLKRRHRTHGHGVVKTAFPAMTGEAAGRVYGDGTRQSQPIRTGKMAAKTNQIAILRNP